jgi:imidazolonepropionase-like amidohydrolase
VEFGATPTEALKAVTVNGAKVLNRDDLGVIRAGAIGDFVLYRGDVSRGDFDVAKVTHVAKGGVLFVEKGQWVGPPPP